MSLSSQTTGSDLEPILDLQVRLFGPLTVRVEGTDLPPLRTRKSAWLLALLVLKHLRPVDRTWLAGTLWPDSDHAESLRNLRNTLSDLRRALGTQAKRLQSPPPAPCDWISPRPRRICRLSTRASNAATPNLWRRR